MEGGGSDKIRVFCRARPISAAEKQSRDVQVVDILGDTVSVRSTHDDAARTYQFDGAFGPNATQLDVYSAVLEPTVEEVLAGFNCTVFAYGQTGTGKTHTMEGGMDNGGLGFSLSPDAPNAGMIQRAVHQIFKKLEHNIDIEYSVRVSHMEIYNEELVDLLAPEGGEAKTLKMLEHPTNGVCVHNLQEVPVTSSDAIFKVLRVSNKKRTTAATKMNHVSSRSHCIFTITVHTKETTIEGEEVVRVGKLNLVDLAGAENVGRSGANKRETGNINQSLLSLGRVITALVQQRSHVPYRESKLTRLLQESLGGRAKTSIIATVAPTASNVEETLSTLDYAHTAKSIINKPQNNNMMTKKALIKDYTSEIERLKQRLLATREKNGVYIPPEEHERMEAEMAANKERLTELEAQLEMKTAQLEELNTMFGNARNELKTTSAALQQTHATLDETQQKLASTHITLKDTSAQLDETKAIVAVRTATEESLHKDAERLLDVLEEREADVEGLHAKIGRKVTVEGQNVQITADFRAYLGERMEQVCAKVSDHTESHADDLMQLRGQLTEFMVSKTSDIDNMCERLDALQNMMLKQQAEMVAMIQNQLNQQSAAVAHVGKTEQQERTRALQALADYSATATRAVDEWRVAMAEQSTQLSQFQAASAAAIDQARTSSEAAILRQKTELSDLKAVSAKDAEHNADWINKHSAEVARAHEAQMVSAEEGKKSLISQISQLFASFVTESNADLSKAADALMADVSKESKVVVAQNAAASKDIDEKISSVEANRKEIESALNELSSSTSAKVSSDVARISEDTTRASLWSQNVENLLAETGALSSKYGEHTSSKLQKVRETNATFSRQHGDLAQHMLGEAQQANEDLQGQLFYVSETVNNLNYSVDAQAGEGKKILDGWSARMESDVTGMEDRFDNYYYSIKEYVPTNTTPAKRAIPIVRDLPVSLPAERIKEMYWENQLAGGNDAAEPAMSSPVHVPVQSPGCTPVSATAAPLIAAAAAVEERPNTPLANLSRAIENARLSLSNSRSTELLSTIDLPKMDLLSPVKPVEETKPAAIVQEIKPAAIVEETKPVEVIKPAEPKKEAAKKEAAKKDTKKKETKKETEKPAPPAPVEQIENKAANMKKSGSKTAPVAEAAAAPVSKHPFVKSKNPDANLIKKLTVKDLKAYLAEANLSDKGLKEELVQRVVDHLTI